MARGDVLYRDSSAWARLAAGTSGNVLMSGGAAANPSWATWASLANTTYTLYAVTDLAKTSDDVLASDPAFDATLKANSKYRLKYSVLWDTSSAPDLKTQFVFSGTTTSVLVRTTEEVYVTANLATGASTASIVLGAITALGVVQPFSTGSTVTVHRISTIAIETGASGGTMSLQWAQDTSSLAAVTRRRNSSVLISEAA